MNDDPAGRGGQFRRGDPWRVDPCHSGIAVGEVILSETNDNGLEPHSELRMQSLFGSCTHGVLACVFLRARTCTPLCCFAIVTIDVGRGVSAMLML